MELHNVPATRYQGLKKRVRGFWLCSLGCMRGILCALLQKSERNLRRALLMLETCRVLQSPMTATQEPQLPDWELYIQVDFCASLVVLDRCKQTLTTHSYAENLVSSFCKSVLQCRTTVPHCSCPAI